ncbi:MAG: TonB-dependent receptor, partial [Pyrinomonadaceae bacterium]
LGERADQNNKQQNFGLTWTHLFSNTTVGEFRYGLGLRTTLVNITAGNDTPIVRFENPVSIGATIIGNAGQFPIQRYQTDNQFVYNLTTLFGNKHFFKAGTDIRRQKLDDLADSNSRGFWQFNRTCNGTTNLYASGFQALINGCVAQFQKGYGPFFLENRINEANLYAEDNWKIRSNFTLNLGLRYEHVSAPEEIAGRLDYGIDADDNNWEPRFGFAWSPEFESGIFRTLFGAQGDSSIRGGYGIYHGRIFQSVFSQSGATVRFNPPNAFFYNRSGAPTGDFAPTRLTDPTNGFVFTPGAPLTSRATLSIIDPGLEMPYTQQWNLSIERQMPLTSSLRVSYTGNRGIGLLKYSLDNLPLHSTSGVLVPNHPFNSPTALYGTALPVGDPRRTDVRGQVIRPAADFICAGTGLNGVGVTAQCPVAVPIGAFEYSYRVTRTNERRPNGFYTTNLATSNAAWSYYNGLQVEWTKRLSHDLNFSAAYTWSKSLDTTSEATFVGTGDSNQNGNDARTARGLSRFHTPHRFTLYGTYRLPFFKGDKGVLGQAFGGWQLSSVVKLIHGTPFSVITTAVDLNFDGFGEPRPVLLDPSILGNSVSNPANALQALPRAAFRTLLPGDPIASVVGRNTFYLDGVQNVDFGIMKVFRMPWKEDHSLTVRADLFNAFNHVQFGFPSNNVTAANFGAITGGATLYLPRNVSVSLKYIY